MLTLELAGQRYNKTAHWQGLLARLDNRSRKSIELKHQNISAVLRDLHAPWISGYKPMSHYQSLLFDVVEARLKTDQEFDHIASEAVERPVVTPSIAGFAGVLVEAPRVLATEDKAERTRVHPATEIKRDYLRQESQNRSLGQAGEKFIVAYEQHRLHTLGAKRLADRVEHVAETRGDGLGFDVLSFDATGKERFIEVKTTAFGREAPFYLTRGELAFSKMAKEQFRLHRLFEFRQQPRMYELTGAVDRHCLLNPVTYLARFA